MWKKWFQALAIFAAGAGVALVAVAIVRGRISSTENSGNQSAGLAHGSGAAKDKQFWTCGMHPDVMQDHPGICPRCHMKLTPMHADSANGEAAGAKKILYWWDPMLGPSSIADKPGKSAMGMDLVPVYANPAGPGVHIDPTIVQNMGVRTAEVTRGPLGKTVRALGVLRGPDTGFYDISVKVGGWIDKLYADKEGNQEGRHVSKGEPLFDLYSQDLQVAEEELISAAKAEQSLPHDAAPALQQEAKSLVKSARRKLQLWDVADQDIDAIAKADKPLKDIPFRSPANGHLVEKMVVQGGAVQPGMKLMRIEDHSQMWLDAQVYEEQFPLVKTGQTVNAAVDGMPGKKFSGTITFISPHLDHATRTFTVRVILENPGFALRPGMYATADIVTQPLDDCIQIPREAVIDTGTRQIVFVDAGQGHFDPRHVRMGIVGDNDRVQIVEGLAPGEIVVTSGQFLMDVESRTTEAIEKLRRASNPAEKSAAAASDNVRLEASQANTSPPPTSESASSQPAVPLPSTSPISALPRDGGLVVVNCSMRKSDWLQRGDAIFNPYLGSEMLECGKITKKLPMPDAGSNLAPVVTAYLEVAKGLAADRLNSDAVAGFKAAIDRLPPGQDADLRAAAGPLINAKDLNAGRAAFGAVSDQLIGAIGRRAP